MTWTVLQQTAPVSEYQLNVLRELLTAQGFTMGNNFRPVMPLNGRQIQLSGASVEEQQARGAPEDRLDTGRTMVWQAGLVPGWAVVLISLAVALNVGLVVWLLVRRSTTRYDQHSKLPTEEH